MAGIYFGAGGVKKVKNIYFGAGGVKKVKKAWIGVGGVPKLFYSTEISYYGTCTPLNNLKASPRGATIGNYALFGAGVHVTSNYVFTNYTTVESYNSSLTKGNPTDLDDGGIPVAAAANNNYAIFIGGVNANKMSAYNSSLVKVTLDVN